MKKYINLLIYLFALGYFIWQSVRIQGLKDEIQKTNLLISHLEQKAIWIQKTKLKLPSYISDIEKYRILSAVWEYSYNYDIEPGIILSMIEKESQFFCRANGNDGEIGLCQILPATARLIIKAYNLPYKLTDIKDIEPNIHIAVIYLRGLLDAYNHDISRALAAYNHGHNGNSVRGRRYAQAILKGAKKYEM